MKIYKFLCHNLILEVEVDLHINIDIDLEINQEIDLEIDLEIYLEKLKFLFQDSHKELILRI